MGDPSSLLTPEPWHFESKSPFFLILILSAVLNISVNQQLYLMKPPASVCEQQVKIIKSLNSDMTVI